MGMSGALGQGGVGCRGIGYTLRAGVVLHDSSAPCWRRPATDNTYGYLRQVEPKFPTRIGNR